jgi:hypothetical protein
MPMGISPAPRSAVDTVPVTRDAQRMGGFLFLASLIGLVAVALLPSTAGAGSKAVELHSAILVHKQRAGPNTLLVIRTTGGHQSLGDRVRAWAGHEQAKAHEDASPDELSSWVITRKSSHGDGGPMLHLLRAACAATAPLACTRYFSPAVPMWATWLVSRSPATEFPRRRTLDGTPPFPTRPFRLARAPQAAASRPYGLP